MEIFGYSIRKLTPEGLLSLSEVSLAGSAAELEALAAFIADAAQRTKAGTLRTDHVHFPSPASSPQIGVIPKA